MIRRALAVTALAALASPAFAQPASPLFASDAPIRLTIAAPLPALFRNRASDSPLSGTLAGPDGQALPIRVKLRGITRRTAETCEFPPIRIDFTGQPPPTSLFAGQNRLKLVTHCRNAPAFQKHLLLEYAAYRMYNLLTPRSFRVRLATIDYRDPDGRPIVTRSGFFVEDLRDVARRNALPQTRARTPIALAQLSPPDAARYALFQHMVANHDWSMRAGPTGEDCCHNAELIGPPAPGSLIPVPYDFDFSGLVGAPYATPPTMLKIASVRERQYRGFCAHNAAVSAAAWQMRELRPQMLGVLAEVPGLDVRAQRTAATFLEHFFADIADDPAIAAKVVNRCVG